MLCEDYQLLDFVFGILYLNNEFVCVKADSISYCLFNNDGFNSYHIGFGKFVINGHKIIVSNIFSKTKTSSLIIQQYQDSLCQLSIMNYEGNPIVYANIAIVYNEDNLHKTLRTYSDDMGIINISSEVLKNIENKVISVIVETVGFYTFKQFKVMAGQKYVIKSLVPSHIPFAIDNDLATLNYYYDKDQLVIQINKPKRKAFLEKEGECQVWNSDLLIRYIVSNIK